MHGRLTDAFVASSLGFVGFGRAPGGGLLPQSRGAGRIKDRDRQAERRLSRAIYKKHCRYLFFNGIQQVWTASESTREEAEKSSCASLKSEPVIHRRRKSSEP